MKATSGTLLRFAFWAWLLFLALRGILHLAPGRPWFLSYVYLAIVIIDITREILTHGDPPEVPARTDQAPEVLTRPERVGFRVMGALLVLVGLAGIGMGVWEAWWGWSEWDRAQRTESVLGRLGVKDTGFDIYFPLQGAAAFAVIGFGFLSAGVWVYRTPRLFR